MPDHMRKRTCVDEARASKVVHGCLAYGHGQQESCMGGVWGVVWCVWAFQRAEQGAGKVSLVLNESFHPAAHPRMKSTRQ